jgi:hypothetical protein
MTDIPIIEAEIEPIKPDTVLYLCDRKACDNCSYSLCNHTTDISHAFNFEKGLGGGYWEKEKRDLHD